MLEVDAFGHTESLI